MTRTKLQQGICEEEGNDGTTCNGFLQVQHRIDKDGILHNVVVCNKCGFEMSEESFEDELEKAYQEEYKVHDEDDNLNFLNNFK